MMRLGSRSFPDLIVSSILSQYTRPEHAYCPTSQHPQSVCRTFFDPFVFPRLDLSLGAPKIGDGSRTALRARSSLCDSVTMYARLFLQALIETYPEEDEASDLFGRDDQLKSLVKTVKGVQDGAAKFSALGVQRGPDFVEAFDAWKEVWMQSRNRKVREKSCLGRFWKLFYQQTEGRSSNREVQRTVEVADVSEIEPIEPSGLSGLSDSESVE
ncbi:unnamed protein product [Durusdinium trenchii]|uniref:Uncharacterized protein n=1 Tax=Durusdinium trenchii TaxID=1381693 RepID=A0ABP0RBM2_9DINO